MKAKHYKDESHHYKMIDKYTVIQVHSGGGKSNASIGLQNYGTNEHFLNKYIKEKVVKLCTKKQYDKAFEKALKTIRESIR